MSDSKQKYVHIGKEKEACFITCNRVLIFQWDLNKQIDKKITRRKLKKKELEQEKKWPTKSKELQESHDNTITELQAPITEDCTDIFGHSGAAQGAGASFTF